MAVVTNGLVPYVGRRAVVSMLMDSTAPHALYIAYGTGTTAVTLYDYRMEAEVKREMADSASRTGAVLTIVNLFAAVTEDIEANEIGIFTASYGGVMIYHAIMATAASLVAETEDTFNPTVEITVQQG